MKTFPKISIVIKFGVLLTFIIASSFLVTSTWNQKKEALPEIGELTYQPELTITEFGEANQLEKSQLKEIFELTAAGDLTKRLDQFSYDREQLNLRVDKVRALTAEHESKDWQKIVAKFSLWFLFMGLAFYLMRKGKVTPPVRKILYLAAVIIFGVILGADPSPMGTVKDAIVLFASKQVIFPPRMIALTLFLLTVFLANKFICSWGCQVGTLQDLIFRFNRNHKDRKGLIRQVKLPFVISNGFRVIFFVIFVSVAFVWAMDLYESIDPFKIYKPLVVSVFGWGFLSVMLVASLFVYRPWCSLFCPFGLVGWLVEKLAVFKIKVDYSTCTACESCSKACPSTVMDAILKQDKVIPDCFSCGVCLETCPTGSISFSTGKRSKPPVDKFSETANQGDAAQPAE